MSRRSVPSMSNFARRRSGPKIMPAMLSTSGNSVEERERLLRRQLDGHQVFAAQQAVLAGNIELAHRMLDSADRGQGMTQQRGLAWSFLREFIHDRLELLPGHSASVDAMDTDPLGRLLVSADANGGVKLWDTSNGSAVSLPRAPLSSVHRVVISADGRTVAACTRLAREVFVWDVASASIIGRLSDGSETAVSATSLCQRRHAIARDAGSAG